MPSEPQVTRRLFLNVGREIILENVFQSQLNLTRRFAAIPVGRSNVAKCRGIEDPVRIIEARMIECIEEFEAQIQFPSFIRKRNRFGH